MTIDGVTEGEQSRLPAMGGQTDQSMASPPITGHGRIRGFISDRGVDYALAATDDGHVVGAEVYLDDLPAIRTTTGPDGGFELAGIPIGEHFVVAEKARGKRSFKVRSRVRLSDVESTADLSNLYLRRTGSIEGVIQADGSDDLLGADVFIEGSTLQGRVTDRGAFSLDEIAIGMYRVTASRLGYKPVTQEIEVKEGEPASLNFRLDRESTPPPPAVNHAPEITSLTIEPTTGIKPGDTVDMWVVATDADGDPISYEWRAEWGTIPASTGPKATWDLPQKAGVYNVYVKATDGRGGEAEYGRALAISEAGEVKVEVAKPPNRPPVIEKVETVPATAIVEPGGRVELTVTASDPDGDPVTIAWTAPAGTPTSAMGRKFSWQAPNRPGSHTLTATVTDGQGTVPVTRVIEVRAPLRTPQPPVVRESTPVTMTPDPASTAFPTPPSIPTPITLPTPTPAPTPVLSSASGSIIGTYAVGGEPRGIAVDGAGYVWVTNGSSDNVTKLSSMGATVGTYDLGAPTKDIAIDAAGNIWVTNGFNGDTVTKLSSEGTVLGTYHVGYPYAIAIDGAGNAWVPIPGVHTINFVVSDKVTKLSPTGVTLGTYKVGDTPSSIAFDTAGRAWVTNFFNNNVTKLSSAGVTLGNFGVGAGPQGIAIDGAGNIWVANQLDYSVSKLSPTGATLGTYMVGAYPTGIAIDARGSVWVTNRGSDNVIKLSSAGSTLGTYVAGSEPTAIAIDGAGNVWVTNTGGNVTKLHN